MTVAALSTKGKSEAAKPQPGHEKEAGYPSQSSE